MGSSHRNVEGVLRNWLACEWATRKGCPVAEGMRLFGEGGPARFVRAAVPQQDNGYDCGLFAVEFARRFCAAAPPLISLRPEHGWPYMFSRAWFPPEHAGERKRDHIHRSILALAGLVVPPPPLDGLPAAGAGEDEPIVLDLDD